MTERFEGAKCVGLPLLFESVHPADHKQAKELCDGCPERRPCQALLDEVVRDSAGMRRAGGGPIGTWAGKLIGKTGEIKAIQQEHGTDRGYHQHRYRRELACAECKAAHLEAYHARKNGAA